MRSVHFLTNFDITPREDRTITYAYYAGNLAELEDSWAEAAVMSGAAIYVDQPAPNGDENHGG